MMIPLKDEQMQIMEQYVNKDKFDVTKMVSYLEKNKVVKNDIFSKCKKIENGQSARITGV